MTLEALNVTRKGTASLTKGALKNEAGSASDPHTASSRTVSLPQSAAAVVHSRESAIVWVKPEAAESTIPRKRFASVILTYRPG